MHIQHSNNIKESV